MDGITNENVVQLKIRLYLKDKLSEDEQPFIPAMRATSGLWRMKTPIKAEENFGENEYYWQASIYIPQNTEFEWRWFIYKEKRIVDMEKSYRHCHIGRFGGIMHTSWNSPAKILEPDMCVVTFYSNYKTFPGERMAIVGSNASLGNWESKTAVPAYEYPQNSGDWSVSVPLDKDVDVEWKWILVDMSQDYVRRWENRPNRLLNCESYDWMTIWAPWNRDDHVTGSGLWERIQWSALRLPEDLDDEVQDSKLEKRVIS